MPRDIRALFEKKRDEFGDIAEGRYVRPHGRMHVIELAGASRRVLVGALRDVTFAPGNIVKIGTVSGRRDRVILGLPGAGKTGAGAFSAVDFSNNDHSTPIILAAHPATVPASSVDYRVVLVGRSLMSSPLDIIEAVVPGDLSAGDPPWILDPRVTVHDAEYIADPTTEGLDLLPAEDAVAVLLDVTGGDAGSISFRARRA